jgi:NCK-associated protein 1
LLFSNKSHSLVALLFILLSSDGFTLCHQFLAQPVAVSLWINALQSGWVLPLFRDEVICFHSYIQTFFDGIKGYGKRVTEVKECFNLAVLNA